MKASETKLQLLIEGQKQYVIPLFQRVYSWDKKQWETLWNDIVELYEEPHSKDHFMGSIVTMPTQSKPEGVSKFLLIDGQQRLTTFFILLIVSITLEKDDNPYRIFESLNYKGLPLTQGDLIRNYFFMRIHIDNQEDIYKKIWHPMQKSLDQFDKEERGKTLSNFIRHFLMKDGKEVKQGDIYSSLKELADKKADDEIIDYLDEILKYSTYYSKLLNS